MLTSSRHLPVVGWIVVEKGSSAAHTRSGLTRKWMRCVRPNMVLPKNVKLRHCKHLQIIVFLHHSMTPSTEISSLEWDRHSCPWSPVPTSSLLVVSWLQMWLRCPVQEFNYIFSREYFIFNAYTAFSKRQAGYLKFGSSGIGSRYFKLKVIKMITSLFSMRKD